MRSPKVGGCMGGGGQHVMRGLLVVTNMSSQKVSALRVRDQRLL